MTVFAPLTLVPPLPELTSPYSFPDVRVRFRQPVSSKGFVDAVWWPRTEDLAEELPDLLDVLWMADRDILRVTYSLDAWGQLPKKMNIDGRTIRLGGFRTSDPRMVRMTDSRGYERIDILTIAPSAEPGYARRLMQLATRAGEARTADGLIAAASATGVELA